MAVPFDNIESSFGAAYAARNNYTGAKRSMEYSVRNYFVVKQVAKGMKLRSRLIGGSMVAMPMREA